VTANLTEMHAAHVAQVNDRIRAAGVCVLHNPGEAPAARYVMRVPIGNELPLCEDCCAWWRADAAARPDDASVQPVWIVGVA
jgi:hypothetical protein